MRILVELEVTYIELGMLVAVYPEKPLASHHVDVKGTTTKVYYSDLEIREILKRMDQGIQEQHEKMADRVKAELFVAKKAGLIEKLTRSLLTLV